MRPDRTEVVGVGRGADATQYVSLILVQQEEVEMCPPFLCVNEPNVCEDCITEEQIKQHR